MTPAFITPAEMIDVAESELFADRAAANAAILPDGQDAPVTASDSAAIPVELDKWITQLAQLAEEMKEPKPVEQALLPASFAIASYRASLLPLLGDESEFELQGHAPGKARLPLRFSAEDALTQLNDPQIAAMSAAAISPKLTNTPEKEHD